MLSAHAPRAGARRPPLRRRAFGIPAHQRVVLANGLTLLTVPRPELPLLAFQLLLRGGALGDPPGRAGVASLTAALLDQGAGPRDAPAFAHSLEGAGGSFSATAHPECLSLSGQFLSQDRELMLELLGDALLRPRLAAAEFARQRERHIGQLRSLKDSDPSELLPHYGRALLFGAHPYGAPASGSEESLARLTRRDVLEYHRAHFGAERAVLAVAGDIEADWLRAEVERRFGQWGAAGVALPAPAPTVKLRRRRVLLVDAPGSAQAYFWLGATGVARGDPQRAALDVVNALFGGRFTSLLNTELRIRTGLSYGAASAFTRGRVAGEFAIRSFAETRHAGRAIDLALRALARLKRTGITQAMLDSSRAYLLGQYPLHLETAPDWAAQLADLELYGLEPGSIADYGPALQRVQLQDAQRVIRQVFPTGRQLALVVIGDAARLRGRLRRYGPVQELPLAAGRFC